MESGAKSASSASSSTTLGPSAESAAAAQGARKKRNRLQYSCKHCREKKLKCNRAVPCDQCLKRGIEDSCEYLIKNASSSAQATNKPAVHRARQIIAENAALRRRVQELEQLVQSEGSQPSGTVPSEYQSERRAEHLAPGSDTLYPPREGKEKEGSDGEGPSGSGKTATVGVLVDESQRHIYEQNWEAILDDVTALTAELTTHEEEMDAAKDDEEETPGPLVLLGGYPDITIEELLEVLPPRHIADRMVSNFFQVEEPAWMIIHIPTFLKQYEQFWAAPEEVSITWLALLYTMFTYASWHCMRSGEMDAYGELGTAKNLYDSFRAAAARCFIRDNYTVPGKYKIEALIIYFGMEYYRFAQHETAPVSTSFLWAAIVRLSLHMGYHRDPRHFDNITPFEGEMRRRVWLQVIEADTIVSFIFGLPCSIQLRFSDTKLPRNLHDEDLNENMKELPPSRPSTEKTRVLYVITSCRILSILAEILNAMMDQSGTAYGKVLDLHKTLEEAEAAIPVPLRSKPLMQSIMDPIGLIIQRYWLLLLVQRSRCVLHRRWFKAGRTDKRYALSRWTCIDAAVRLLQNQFEMDNETKPGGRLAKERWVVTRNIPDYLLANMLLCLELYYLTHPTGEADLGVVIPEEKILEMLRMSRKIWQTSHKESGDASRAFKIISRMLSISTGKKYSSSPVSGGDDEFPEDNAEPETMKSPEYHTPRLPDELNYSPASFAGVRGNTPIPQPQQFFAAAAVPPPSVAQQWPTGSHAAPAYPVYDINEMGMVSDIGMSTDWSLFDAQVQNFQADETDIQWGSFFDPTYQQ